MLRIGICDDSAEARLSLHAMLERLLEKRAVESRIYEFSSGEGLLGWMEKHTGEVDLVFLDIEMGGMNGMEAAKAPARRAILYSWCLSPATRILYSTATRSARWAM